jgi:uncharacterized damage-inducible protein DinB
MKSLLINYLEYNHWANEKICKYLAGIDNLDISANKQQEYITIKKIIMHIADGEQTWLARLNGENIPHMHNLDIGGDLNSICGLVRRNSINFLDYVNTQDEKFFRANTEYINLKGKKFSQNNAEIILHCMNHSTFHRGQVISMLRHVGYTDQSASDFILFLREKGLHMTE